jgi:alkanesulfonate monooxygenase SsuD/methylene tetrahydromethanopterin reductase-like flavin-dependent oxidoreductase (luciferase family)
VVEHAFVAGSPGTVAQQIAALRDVGVRNLLLNVNVGQMPSEQVERSMRLFGEKVLPAFRSH